LVGYETSISYLEQTARASPRAHYPRTSEPLDKKPLGFLVAKKTNKTLAIN
jgi:hypothetical protein